VAARKFGRGSKDGSNDRQANPHGKWHELSGEPQTDERFTHEIVDRMGAEFYQGVFAPAVRVAWAKGETYESTRDRLRRRWKPARTTSDKG
jgi:hypothetical protein